MCTWPFIFWCVFWQITIHFSYFKSNYFIRQMQSLWLPVSWGLWFRWSSEFSCHFAVAFAHVLNRLSTGKTLNPKLPSVLCKHLCMAAVAIDVAMFKWKSDKDQEAEPFPGCSTSGRIRLYMWRLFAFCHGSRELWLSPGLFYSRFWLWLQYK